MSTIANDPAAEWRPTDDAGSRAGFAADTTTEYASRFSDTGNELVAQAGDYIAARPLCAIGVAAATGYLLVRLLR
jgi:ElaB/YqjD/DUF883 family membrane-anchored ribosome-binding protein